MAVKYGQMNVDERYAQILEPNLYYNPVLVPGVTCTDEYETGPAGQIYVHKITTSAVEPGTPGRDFTDTAVSDTLIPIQVNNNFQRSYKLYGVQAAAVDFNLGEHALSTATQECREGWMLSGVGCLVNDATAATLTSAIDDVKADIIATRTEIVKAKGRADVVMCSPEFYGKVLLAAGKEFTPTMNDRIAAEVARHDVCRGKRYDRQPQILRQHRLAQDGGLLRGSVCHVLSQSTERYLEL